MKNRISRKSHCGIQTDMPFWSVVIVKPVEAKPVVKFDDVAWVKSVLARPVSAREVQS